MALTKEDIKLKNARTCNHCPALLVSMSGVQICSLGYLVKKEENSIVWNRWSAYEDLFIKIRPAEKCPKPKNISESAKIRRVIDVYRYYTPGTKEYNAYIQKQTTNG